MTRRRTDRDQGQVSKLQTLVGSEKGQAAALSTMRAAAGSESGENMRKVVLIEPTAREWVESALRILARVDPAQEIRVRTYRERILSAQWTVEEAKRLRNLAITIREEYRAKRRDYPQAS